MTVLGIDWGQKHIGLALGRTDTGIASPLTVISAPQAIQKISSICRQENVKTLVIGLSEGRSAALARAFAAKLEPLSIPLEFSDETLSTADVLPKNHAAAAAVILELWLDDHRSLNV